MSTTIHGVDFSGADSGGGHKIVVASQEAAEIATVTRRIDRAGLRRMILESRDQPGRHLWRIDAPFSLPRSVYAQHGIEEAWRTLAEWMGRHDSAREWRRAMRRVDRKEPRRTCDKVARTPMAPMNLRVFKQTWTVVRDLLVPLADQGVCIAPLHRTDSSVVVTEGCPASVLHARGESPRGYKGDSANHRQRRVELCDRAKGWGIRISQADREAAVADTQGDVLDALLLLADRNMHVPPPEAVLEGWIW